MLTIKYINMFVVVTSLDRIQIDVRSVDSL